MRALPSLVFEIHQEIADDRHQLPGDQKRDRVVGNQDQYDRREQSVIEEAEVPQTVMPSIFDEIAARKERHIAEMIGTTRSRVSHFMNKFRKLGFIDYNGHLEVHSSLLNVVLHDQPQISNVHAAAGSSDAKVARVIDTVVPAGPLKTTTL